MSVYWNCGECGLSGWVNPEDNDTREWRYDRISESHQQQSPDCDVEAGDLHVARIPPPDQPANLVKLRDFE
jgi:hypothetical protein